MTTSPSLAASDLSGYFEDPCARTDPELHALIAGECDRQSHSVELVASENFVSRAVLDAQGSIFCNKTVTGAPGARFHAGADFADALERLAMARACEAFGCSFANVQPHSGIQANLAVFRALLQPGDKTLALAGDAGGHFSHGADSNLSGMMISAHFYGTDREGLIDYDALAAQALELRPKLIVTGGAAYPRAIDFARLRGIADSVGALLMADIAHIAGLVAAGVHPDPFPHCDVVTTTTYKSLRGARGGIILTNAPEIARALEKATSPGVQGSPLLHAVAGKAACLGEVLKPEFRDYGRRVLENARALAAALSAGGTDVLCGGTDTPLVIADLRRRGLHGQPLVESLDRANITCNRSEIPHDATDPALTSGLRLGVSAMTTRGLGTAEMETIAGWIGQLLDLHQTGADTGAAEAAINADSRALMAKFPLYAAMTINTKTKGAA